MLSLKRNMLNLGDFEYIVSNSNSSISKIIRQRDGLRILYISQGCSNDFTLVKTRKYELTDSIDGDSCRIGAYYSTSYGLQGNIFYCVKKGKFFWRNIFYWSTFYNNIYYKIYEVGRKREGTYFCIYADDVLVAMIKKSIKTNRNSTYYEIFSERNVPKELLLVINLYIDLVRYYPDSRETNTYSTECKITTQKELQAKYDPDFIPRIKAMQGIVD